MPKRTYPCPALPAATLPSARALRKEKSRLWREHRSKLAEKVVDLMTTGLSQARVARTLGLTEMQVKRALDSELRGWTRETPARFVGLQISRLHKALSVVDVSLEEGRLDSIEPYLRVVERLDRYYGLALREGAGEPRPPEALLAAPSQRRLLTKNGAQTLDRVETPTISDTPAKRG